MKASFKALLAAGMICSFCGMAQDAAKPQVVILKLDDITPAGAPRGIGISQRWQRVADYVEKSGIKASFGIIGYSLEGDNKPYLDWIRETAGKGRIEFWNHGYRNRKSQEGEKGEFEEGSVEEQREALMKTQRLAKEKLGIELKAFGPHWSGTNENTEKAIESIPEIKLWFFGPANRKNYTRTSVPRILNLENPIFRPNFEKFKADYEAKGGARIPCVTLQGHSNQWEEKEWENFVRIVEFLKSKGCVFMTPSEYLKSIGAE